MSAARHTSDDRLPPPRLGFVLGAFAAVAALSAAANLAAATGRARPPGLIDALAESALIWLPFALLALPILWVARRFPLRLGALKRSVPAHGAAFLLMSATQTLVYDAGRLLAEAQVSTAGVRLGFHLLRFVRNDIWIYGGIVGAYYVYVFAVRSREREQAAAEASLRAAQLETALTNARLDALTAQLQPHFLFNALNSISVLVLKGESAQATRMLRRLSDLLRASLVATRDQTVTLREELEFTSRYLDIEAVRFPDRLRVTTTVAPDVLDARVPVLILQPLVENAIRHGIAAVPDAGRVEIGARRVNGSLRLEVRDDGSGPGDGARGDGVGLTNTRERLRQLYGDEARLRVEADPAGGTVAMVEIPAADAAEPEA